MKRGHLPTHYSSHPFPSMHCGQVDGAGVKKQERGLKNGSFSLEQGQVLGVREQCFSGKTETPSHTHPRALTHMDTQSNNPWRTSSLLLQLTSHLCTMNKPSLQEENYTPYVFPALFYVIFKSKLQRGKGCICPPPTEKWPSHCQRRNSGRKWSIKIERWHYFIVVAFPSIFLTG